MRFRRWKWIVIFTTLLIIPFSQVIAKLKGSGPLKPSLSTKSTYQVKRILIVKIWGPITPVTSQYFKRAMEEAKEGDLILIELNTPGGGVTPTREIAEEILSSPYPVVSFIYPPGGHAASAGSFIVLASHLAYMAPGTNLGAAHPITIGGSEDKKTLEISLKKAKSDLAAWARSLAELRGRDKDLAQKLVLESLSLSPDEAIGKITDGIAKDLDSLVKALNGQVVSLSNTDLKLVVDSPKLEEFQMTPLEKGLQVIAHPQVAYLLVTLGTYLIIIEVFHFTGGFLFALGALLLITGLTGLGVLSFNVWGLIILLLGIGLIIADVKLTAHGILALIGVGMTALGSVLTFKTKELRIEIPWLWISLVTSIMGFLAMTLVFIAIRTLRKPTRSGEKALIGKIGVVKKVRGDELVIEVEGVLWKALPKEGDLNLKVGDKVKVVNLGEGLDLIVEPLNKRGERDEKRDGERRDEAK